MCRENLKSARKSAGMTQQQTADAIGMSLRNYCNIESGKVVGTIRAWDALEDLFGVNQRELRRTSPEGNRS